MSAAICISNASTLTRDCGFPARSASATQRSHAARVSDTTCPILPFSMEMSASVPHERLPPAIAGYYATRGLVHISVPAEGGRNVLALIGAIIVGTVAWMRITPVAPTRGGQAVPPSAQPPPASANRDG